MKREKITEIFQKFEIRSAGAPPPVERRNTDLDSMRRMKALEVYNDVAERQKAKDYWGDE